MADYYIIGMKTEESRNRYWCHCCRLEFVSTLQPGSPDILCPQCSNDFCELISHNSAAKYFQPFQKEPPKKKENQLHLQLRAAPISIHELTQVLEEETHLKEGVEVDHHDLQPYFRLLEQDAECSVCREDLKRGDRHLIFGCRHAFHEECLIDWLKIKNSCPTCRKKMIEN